MGNAIPIAAHFLPLPLQPFLIAEKRCRRKQKSKAAACIGDVFHQKVNHLGCTANEWLLAQPGPRIVKHPSADLFQPVGCDGYDLVGICLPPDLLSVFPRLQLRQRIPLSNPTNGNQ